MGTKRENDRFAVYAVDPGGTTGVASGIFRMSAARPPKNRPKAVGGVPRVLRVGKRKETHEVTGDPIEQAVQIWRDYWEWSAEVVLSHGVRPRDVWLVIEDFVLRPGRATASRDQQASIKIISAIEALRLSAAQGWDRTKDEQDGLVYGRFVKVQPSEHKSYVTKERAKRWKLWVVGSAHERDANTIMAFAVGKVTHGVWPKKGKGE